MRFRLATLMICAALIGAGAAHAETFLVLSSADPSLKKGTSLEAGALLPAQAGSVVTVMSETGEVVRLTAGASGLQLPAPSGKMSNSTFVSLKNMLLRKPPTRRAFGAMRGAQAECPAVETLITLEAILEADKTSACRTIASEALDRFITQSASSGGSDGDTPAPSSGS
ncbi:MAG: hypothetical protein KGS00_05800 [Alphaproteobacteria bacterium]|nr:hypothetical protein [Alphaproteobacteria bacterium]